MPAREMNLSRLTTPPSTIASAAVCGGRSYVVANQGANQGIRDLETNQGIRDLETISNVSDPLI
jgi:hypothetical protein